MPYNRITSTSSSQEADNGSNRNRNRYRRRDTFTVDDAIEHFGFGPFQFLISMFAGISWMAEAMEMTLLSMVSPSLVCEWGINKEQQAMVISCVFVGMVVSSLVWGVVCDRYGRRIGIMMISLTIFFFGVCSTLAQSFTVFTILRTLMGFGMGGVPQSVTYYSEFLPKRNRAFCVICMQIFWAFGGVFESLFGYLAMDSIGWRWLLGISTIPMLISAGTCLLIPESARFLVISGRVDEAYSTLEMVAEWNKKSMLVGRLVESRKGDENDSKGKLMDLFSSELRITTLLVLPIWFISTMSYYAIIFYTTVLFISDDKCHGGGHRGNSSVGDTAGENYSCKAFSDNDYLGLITTSFAEVPGLLLATFLLHFIGRRCALASQFGIYVLVMLPLFACFEQSWMVTALLSIARAIASGAFQTAYVYTPEVYPTTMRAIGLGAGSGMGRIGALISPYIAIVTSKGWLMTPVVILSALSSIGFVCSLMLPIETRGRQMQDRIGQGSKSGTKKSISSISHENPYSDDKQPVVPDDGYYNVNNAF